MIKTLPQIMSTFLAIGATFIAGYIIYLYTQKSNIDEKIEKESFQMIVSYRKIVVGVSFIPYGYLEKRSEIELLQENPNLTEIQVIEKFCTLLINLGDKKSEELLRSWLNDSDHYQGPAFVYFIQKTMNYLFHHGARSYSSIPFNRKNYSEIENKKMLFPYGPVNMDQWLEDADRIRTMFGFFPTVISVRDYFVSEYFSWVEMQDDFYQKVYKKYYNQEWIERANKELENIFLAVDKIKSLRRLSESNNLTNRLPNLVWIIILGLLSFMIGVITPVVIDSLNIDKPMPPVANLIIMSATFTFVFGSAYLLYKDITHEDKSYVEVDNSTELKKYLEGLKNKARTDGYIEFIVINDYLLGPKNEGLQNTIKKKMVLLKEKIIQTNNDTIILCKKLGDSIKKDERLKKYKNDEIGSGSGYSLVDLLLEEKSLNYLNPNTHIRFAYQRIGEKEKQFFQMRTPDNEKELNDIVKILNENRKNILEGEESWIDTRNSIIQISKDIVNILNMP